MLDTPDQEPDLFRLFWPLANFIVVGVLAWLIFFPYLEAEINSWLHWSHQADLTRYCTEGGLPEPTVIKIVNLQKYRGEIRFYCFYEDKGLNQEIVIHKHRDQWRIFSKKNLYQNGIFYWPIYPTN